MERPGKPIRVLYFIHYGVLGGAQRSLSELVLGFGDGVVSPHFVIPFGTGADSLKRAGFEVTMIYGGISKFDHTRAGYYKGLRWLILIREFLYAFPTVYIFLNNKKKFREFDIIHINEITCILPLILAKKILKKPVVIHARAVLNNDPRKWRTKLFNNIVNKYADKIIAIDQTVAESIRDSPKKTIVYNSLNVDSKIGRLGEGFGGQLSQLPKRKLTVGFIGAIHKNKGIFDLLSAMKMCKENALDISLIIAGNNNASNKTYINFIYDLLKIDHDGNKILLKQIEDDRLQDCVHTVGYSTNTGAFFEYIDIICFPSYYNAVGRPVFEAAFFGKPSVVAIRDPHPDTFIEGVTGISVKEKDPQSIFNALRRLYNDPGSISRMGAESVLHAKKYFTLKANCDKVLGIYHELMSSGVAGISTKGRN